MRQEKGKDGKGKGEKEQKMCRRKETGKMLQKRLGTGREEKTEGGGRKGG
jgi:hypothetical protein